MAVKPLICHYKYKEVYLAFDSIKLKVFQLYSLYGDITQEN
jgi:hypothetical protein